MSGRVSTARRTGGPGQPGHLRGETSSTGEQLVNLAKTHSSEAFVACDDPLEAVVFSALVEILKRQDRLEEDMKKQRDEPPG